jgi:hypothetical protein
MSEETRKIAVLEQEVRDLRRQMDALTQALEKVAEFLRDRGL